MHRVSPMFVMHSANAMNSVAFHTSAGVRPISSTVQPCFIVGQIFGRRCMLYNYRYIFVHKRVRVKFSERDRSCSGAQTAEERLER